MKIFKKCFSRPCYIGYILHVFPNIFVKINFKPFKYHDFFFHAIPYNMLKEQSVNYDLCM